MFKVQYLVILLKGLYTLLTVIWPVHTRTFSIPWVIINGNMQECCHTATISSVPHEQLALTLATLTGQLNQVRITLGGFKPMAFDCKSSTLPSELHDFYSLKWFKFSFCILVLMYKYDVHSNGKQEAWKSFSLFFSICVLYVAKMQLPSKVFSIDRLFKDFVC